MEMDRQVLYSFGWVRFLLSKPKQFNECVGIVYRAEVTLDRCVLFLAMIY